MTSNVRLPLTSALPTADRLAALKELYPEAFADGKIDFAKLKQLLGEAVETDRERYGLNWAGKAEAMHVLQSLSVGTLKPARQDSVNFDTTKNLIIEGDNLEVLKLLQKSYFGKVKMIYIDPPYNTGNEFIYPDNYREGLEDYLRYSGQKAVDGAATTSNKETDGRYHSKWLSMMYPRLFLARNLLREDGVIFISIDDHEVHNLRMMMNEIFGEENFISQIVILTNPKGRVLGQHFAQCHDYIIVYGKSPFTSELSVAKTDSEMLAQYPEIDGTRRFRLLELRNTHRQFGRHNRATLYFPLYINPANGNVKLCESSDSIEAYPNWDDGFEGCWTWGQRKVAAENDLLVGKMTAGRWKVFRKAYATDEVGEAAKKKFPTVWTDKEFHTEKGQAAFNALVPGRIFQSPKPPGLIKRLVQLAASEEDEDIILDFFAGSGTTAQAVLELNKEDGGNRKFILVQLPEPTQSKQFPTIAHITRERVKRVIANMNETTGTGSLLLDEGAPQDLGFKALTLAASNFHIWQGTNMGADAGAIAAQLELFADNLQPDAADEDILFEILLKAGYDLNVQREVINVHGHPAHSIADGQCIICLAREIDREAVDAIIARQPEVASFLDAAFHGNDALLTNTLLQMQGASIHFHTI